MARFYQAISSLLCSECDKLVYFWSLCCYLLYNAITVEENILSKKPTLFTSKLGDPLYAILIILTTAKGITPLTESPNIAAMTVHFVVNLFSSHLTVCLRNAP